MENITEHIDVNVKSGEGKNIVIWLLSIFLTISFSIIYFVYNASSEEKDKYDIEKIRKLEILEEKFSTFVLEQIEATMNNTGMLRQILSNQEEMKKNYIELYQKVEKLESRVQRLEFRR